jgi:signal transduction histidine kinase
LFGIRQKLLIGFIGILAVVVAFGALTIRQLSDLGRAIDVILRENYRSVIACQTMKESLGRMDREALIVLSGIPAEEPPVRTAAEESFRRALDAEIHNITISGEKELAESIRRTFLRYLEALDSAGNEALSLAARRAAYFDRALPASRDIEAEAQKILEMNQRAMETADTAARAKAGSARRTLAAALISCLAVIAVFGPLLNRWVLKPLRALTASAEEIKKGNLELVVEDRGRDEVGQLARAFNEMSQSLRAFRRDQDRRLQLCRRATGEVFRALPEVLAVLDPDGRVEVSTETAARLFGLKPGVAVLDAPDRGLADWARTVLSSAKVSEEAGPCLQKFDGGRERFFEPAAFPILTAGRETSGFLFHLRDVTQLREQQELKQGVVSTVSHQLKTPLTSLRMSVHLLLQESLGPLNKRQAELLLAAREESDRLSRIIESLVEIERIEAGKAPFDVRPVPAASLARDAVDRFLAEAKDRGVSLENRVRPDLPDVLADRNSIQEVFANLLQNALRFTLPGGSVEVGAEAEAGVVRFFVRDTGRGIPADLLPHLFEEFVRGPGPDGSRGAGLGLAIVRKIVAAQGGTTGAESEENRGSKFWFTLPRAS